MTTISNVPASINWKIYKGDTARLTIIMQNDNGTELDITNYTFTGEIKAQAEDAIALQQLNISSTSSLLSIEIADTESLPKISYFDIQSIYEGTTWTILKGTISVEQDVTY
jgi:hypothetical protein